MRRAACRWRAPSAIRATVRVAATRCRFVDRASRARSRRVRAAPPRSRPRARTCCAHHGDERVDDWYWLRERDDPDVLAYLEAENAYTDARSRRPAALRDAALRRRSSAACRRPTLRAGAPTARTSTSPAPSRAAVRRPLPTCRPARRAARSGRAPGARRRGRRARRERARRRARLLRARRPRRSSPTSASLAYTHRHERRRALRAALPRRSTTRRATSTTSSPTCTTASRGPTTARPSSTSGPTTPCARARCGATPRHAGRRRRARVPGGRRALLRRRRPHAQRPLRR